MDSVRSYTMLASRDFGKPNPLGGRRMKCTRCGTNVDREAHDRGICFDCYCQLDLQDYEAHLQLREEEWVCIDKVTVLVVHLFRLVILLLRRPDCFIANGVLNAAIAVGSILECVIAISRRVRRFTRISLLYWSIEPKVQLLDRPRWRVKKIGIRVHVFGIPWLTGLLFIVIHRVGTRA